jgi:hypothetical protein
LQAAERVRVARDNSRGRWSVEVANKVAGQLRGIGTGAVDETRLAPTQKRHAHEMEAGARVHAAVVADAALAVEHWGVQP